MTRKIDIEFGAEERLWRRIAYDGVKRGRVLPNSLRFQISVVRERYGQKDNVVTGKWNGIAEINAQTACDAGAVGNVRAVCVDDPNDIEPGHALIALIAAPGLAVTEDDVRKARNELAKQMTIIVLPERIP